MRPRRQISQKLKKHFFPNFRRMPESLYSCTVLKLPAATDTTVPDWEPKKISQFLRWKYVDLSLLKHMKIFIFNWRKRRAVTSLTWTSRTTVQNICRHGYGHLNVFHLLVWPSQRTALSKKCLEIGMGHPISSSVTGHAWRYTRERCICTRTPRGIHAVHNMHPVKTGQRSRPFGLVLPGIPVTWHVIHDYHY